MLLLPSLACSLLAICASKQAPAQYAIQINTDVGGGSPIVVDVNRAEAPLGADRLYELVAAGFFNNSAFFRMLPPNGTGCVFTCGGSVQFGIAGQPAVNEKWAGKTIADDPVVSSNTVGTLAFAMAGAASRTTQLFLNLGNNPKLDKNAANPPKGPGFAAFGKIRTAAGLATARSVTNPTPGNTAGVDQSKYAKEGNAWLRKEYPSASFITSVSLVRSG